MSDAKFNELESLLFDWETGSLDQAGLQRLRELLAADASARTHFVRLQQMTAALSLESEVGPPTEPAPERIFAQNTATVSHQSDAVGLDTAKVNAIQTAPDSDSIASRSWRVNRWVLAAAAVVVCALSGRLLQLELTDNTAENGSGRSALSEHEPSAEGPVPEAMAQGVAIVTRLVDVEWGPEQKRLEIGDPILPGRLAIESGYAQIEFYCGAAVILEGPAELDLKSPVLAYVRSGRLRAQVPPAARGFTLEVEDLKVVDLGTEFGLSVTDAGASIQVFDGEVELQQTAQADRLLSAGEALLHTPAGAFQETESTPTEFLDLASLESRARNQYRERYERWQEWSQRLRRDERVIAYYAFDEPGGWTRRMPCSLLPANSELDAAIVGARPVAGRWPSKGGLEFKRPGDRMRVQIPGEFKSLTFACWVNIDSLDRRFNSLFLTDNYNQGEPHWQILDTGQLYFSVRPKGQSEPGPRDYKALSPPFWKASLSGRWLHLATVYDVESRSITHYLDGQLLSHHDVPPEQIVATRIGTASIGNWSLPTQSDASFAIRNLNGSIDEFTLYAAALTGEQIKDIYDHGKP